MIDINSYKKDRTVRKTCYNKNKRKNNNNTLPPNIENNINVNNKNSVLAYENHASVVIGPKTLVKPVTCSKY